MHVLCLCSKEHYETRNWIRNFNRILSNCWLRIWIWGRRYLQELYYFMGLKWIDPVGKIFHHLQDFWRRNAQLMLYAVGLILHSVFLYDLLRVLKGFIVNSFVSDDNHVSLKFCLFLFFTDINMCLNVLLMVKFQFCRIFSWFYFFLF